MARLLRMPGISADAEEVVFLEWCATLGSTLTAGDAIATVETEKANVDIEADSEAILWRTLIEPGASVAVGLPIAVLVGIDEDVADEAAVFEALGLAASSPAASVEAVPEPSAGTSVLNPAQAVMEPGDLAAPASVNGRVFASPIARRIARERGVAIETVTGTGPGGRIVRADVERVDIAASDSIATQQSTSAVAPNPVGAYTDIPHTGMRRAIARALSTSKQQAPHFYLDATCRVEALLALRQQVNEERAAKLSINDFLLKAAARALMDVPEMNVIWMDDCVRRFDTVDICVAIGSDSGLVTPVLRSVESLSVTQISEQVRDFSVRANEGRLKQHELEGGTFSVSNLGMYGVEGFSAILNPPQAGILAVGAVMSTPVVVGDQVHVGKTMRVTLSVDHRPVDGVIAARWLRRFTTMVENPALMLV